jgi:energy-coupling factor transporter ATP-binding protein EcfA2
MDSRAPLRQGRLFVGRASLRVHSSPNAVRKGISPTERMIYTQGSSGLYCGDGHSVGARIAHPGTEPVRIPSRNDEDQSVTTLADRIRLSFDRRLKDFPALTDKQSEADRFLKALEWKTGLAPDFPAIACLMGGTGTGKSTLFNSLAGSMISRVGIRRPCTTNPVLFVHRRWMDETVRCPFLEAGPAETGVEGEATVNIAEHEEPRLSGLILVDTPDVDSVELANRIVAENFFIISDILILVTSQEKYGDLTGLEIRERAMQWKKRSLSIMNKVVSDVAFEDFRRGLGEGNGADHDPVRIERSDSAVEFIPGLADLPEFSELYAIAGGATEGRRIRIEEMERLRRETLRRVESLGRAAQGEMERVNALNNKVRRILERVTRDMETKLDGVISEDVQTRVQGRLGQLLKKYDIFFVPRAWVRKAVTSALGALGDIFSFTLGKMAGEDPEKAARNEDFEETRSKVQLEPLEWAVASLNREIADLLASDTALEDLRTVARNDIPRWGPNEIRARFDDAFPGVENLLESEFDGFRRGLSRTDELKLYGSYTLWALVLITAEIVLGGGFTLLDALLGSVVVPFIPKWLLSLKVLDLLREIGGRVNEEYRRILRAILESQANLYIDEFRGMLPDAEAMGELVALRKQLQG